MKMFDGLLKPKFYSKCKSCVKLIKTRLEVIRKKRNAVEKFLKNDITDLLRSSLDYNAYGRAEGLLVEQNMSSCYELIAKYVGFISDHVRDLCKGRDCPDECKEAIPSLMYAAARFSDLPELRELRTLFTEKFGNSLEPYISKEFVKKLRPDPPSREMKIQLLRDLAKEFSIEWNSKALEKTLHSPEHQLHEEKTKHDPLEYKDDEKWHKNNDVAIPKIDGRDYLTSRGNERDTLSKGRKDMSDASWRLQRSSEDETTTDNSSKNSKKASSSSLESVSEDEVETKKPFSYSLVPPPYVKAKLDEVEVNLKRTTDSEATPEKDSNHNLHEQAFPKKPMPKSVRRPLKPPPPNHETLDDDSRDEEKRIMDGLLMHYRKKQSTYEPSMGRKARKEGYPLVKQVQCENVQNTRQRKSGSSGVPPIRAKSLPSEETGSVKALKGGHERATSLVNEILKAEKQHVHPSLPDYDDLYARLAARRGTHISEA